MVRVGLAMLVLLLGSLCPADESEQARAILQRALRAVGEGRAGDRPPSAVWKAKVTLHGLGDPIVYTGEWIVRSPERVHIRMSGTFHGRPFERLLIIRGDHGWMKQDGTIEELSRDRLAEEKERLHSAWVATLLPLRQADFDLKPLSQSQAGVKRTGLRVHQAGHRDVVLYFDEGGRLVESQTRHKDPATGTERMESVQYKAYRPFDGVPRATRLEVRVDGTLLAEAQVTSYTRKAPLDERLFQKPEP